MTSAPSAIWKHFRKSVPCLIGVGIIVLLVAAPGPGRELIERMDRAIGDWIIRQTGGPPEKKELVLLGIDESSMSLTGLEPAEIAASPTLELMKTRFPWDRRVWAAAIDRLADAGAKLIVIDVIFAETSTPEADAELAAAIQRHPGKVVLGSAFGPGDANDEGEGFVLSEPTDQLWQAGPAIGFANFYPDKVDGLIRSARYTTTLTFENKGKRMPGETEFKSMAAEVIHAMGAEVPSGNRELRFAGTGTTGAAHIYTPKPVYGIFAKEWDTNYQHGEFFRDKVVMIGPVAPRFQDIHNTPMGPITGPQLHLQAVACGLDKAFVRRYTNPWPGILFLGMVVLAWTRSENRPLLSIFGVMAIAAMVLLGTWLVGSLLSWLPPVSGGLLALGSGWAVAQSYKLLSERLERLRLRRDFRRFVSRDVADAMIDQPEQWQTTSAGVKRRVVVLFSDVRGFTERSENTDPEQLVKQLNQYLTSMVEVIFRHGGTLDKFIGDAVMAHWGALGTGTEEDHARKAILAAKDMIVVLKKLNAEWVAAGKEPFKIGVGLHLGEAVAGEIGSPDRTEFGVLGDTVNLASRLEGLTKVFCCDVLFSDSVKVASGLAEGVLDLGRVRVKGRRNAVQLFGVGDETLIRENLKSFERDADGVIVMTVK